MQDYDVINKERARKKTGRLFGIQIERLDFVFLTKIGFEIVCLFGWILVETDLIHMHILSVITTII